MEPDTPPSTDELEDIRAQRARSARQQASTITNNVAPQVASPESQIVACNGSNTLEQTEQSASSVTSNSSLDLVSAEQVMQFIFRIQAAGNANILDPQLLGLLSQPRQPTPSTTSTATGHTGQNAPPDTSKNTPSTSGNVPRIQADDNANIDPQLLGPESHQPTPRTTLPATGQNVLPDTSENTPSPSSSGHMPPTASGSEPPMDNISEQRGRKRTQPQAAVVQSTGRVTRQNKKKKP